MSSTIFNLCVQSTTLKKVVNKNTGKPVATGKPTVAINEESYITRIRPARPSECKHDLRICALNTRITVWIIMDW